MQSIRRALLISDGVPVGAGSDISLERESTKQAVGEYTAEQIECHTEAA